MSAIYFIANYTIYVKLDFDKKGLMMPHNILMSKIRCYNPNKSHSALKNLNYIIYIGTRPGVDLTDVQLDEITALTEENIIQEEPSANSQYIYYIAKRQNSQGLFGNFKFNNITEVAHEVRNVTDAGVNVYRGIVSLSEEDALELGYNKKENWVNYMNSVMNDIGDRFGIPLTSLKWCAAVHMEHGHPHCHYTFWRTDGKVMSSYIHVSKQNEIREFLSKEMFKAEREMLISKKNKYRDATVDAAHTFMNNLDMDFIPCAKLEWTKGFKNTRKELYSLDKNDPDYLKKFNRVLDELITYHNQGNLPATYLLARLYSSKAYPVYNSEISDMLYTLSYNNFKDIYNNQNTPFLHGYLSYHLGKMSERGLGCEVNYNDAVAYYKNCLNDNVYAQYALANIYLNEKATPLTPELYMTALDLLKHASAENPYAAYQYAQHLENPLYDNVKLSDATQDGIYHYYNTALTGFLKEQDSDSNLDGSILYKIGKIYYEGKGCEKDDEKAYEYFMKAADCKNKNAYYALGKTCSDKTSTHYDIIRAEQYYLKAYEEYYDSETGESHAPSYLKKSMADLYANQEHGIYDINKAISLYKDCAENDNDTFSMFKLGSIYLNGNGVYKDITLGLHYLNDAADCGNKFAKVTLADFYADATHNHYNIAKAISLYKDCIKNDADSYSMSKLGSIYLFGNGVPKDEALGLKYLNDAAAQGNEYAQKTIYFYNNMKHSMAVSASFSLAYHFLNSLSDRRNQEHLLRIHSKSTSKEARIDAYKKNKEHSSADFEHE